MGDSSSVCLNNKSIYITTNVNVVRHSINVMIKLGAATVGLHLEFVLYVLKILGCACCIGNGFEPRDAQDATKYDISLSIGEI